jgi:hypothetical protein
MRKQEIIATLLTAGRPDLANMAALVTARTNVASTPLAQARQYAAQTFETAGKDLAQELPDFDRNYKMLKKSMDRAKDFPRIDMPVIEPQDMKRFAKDLKSGRLDIFKPWAKGHLFTPKNLNRKTGEEWLRLGFNDGAPPQDDVVGAKWTSIPAKKLLPTQSEIWLDKVVGNIVKFGVPKQGSSVTDQTIIVSKEGYILDGHHRYGQAMLADPNLKLKALFIPIDIDTLVKVGRSYGNSIGNEQKASVMTSRKQERDIIKTLCAAGRDELARRYAVSRGYRVKGASFMAKQTKIGASVFNRNGYLVKIIDDSAAPRVVAKEKMQGQHEADIAEMLLDSGLMKRHAGKIAKVVDLDTKKFTAYRIDPHGVKALPNAELAALKNL